MIDLQYYISNQRLMRWKVGTSQSITVTYFIFSKLR